MNCVKTTSFGNWFYSIRKKVLVIAKQSLLPLLPTWKKFKVFSKQDTDQCSVLTRLNQAHVVTRPETISKSLPDAMDEF